MLARTLAAGLRGVDGLGSPLQALRVARRAGHSVKAPGVPWTLYHPSVQDPERKVRLRGSLEGPAKYVPKNFRHQQYVESIRSGEYLGPDWPYNFLPLNHWMERRYNATYNPIPPDMSPATGVLFVPRLNIWSVEWHEQEKQRIRWFRAQYGFTRAKRTAEEFRKALVQAGRVDNRRTEREIRLQHLAGQAARSLFKKKFAKKDARRLGNSGTKLGKERKVREDYKRRGLLP
mmetsp:Transcript_9621/g.29902  ORF Transcript_9621/g.29902 Transcript_9621/m.29902 type:complete len:232 (-) Transcript_9621:93-788(-)